MDRRLNDLELEASPVVANCDMNRQRGCTGVNSYQRELKLDPIDWLDDRLKTDEHVAWLDLCCGEGNALIEAAAVLRPDSVSITGIDLVDFFHPAVADHPNVRLLVGSLLEAKFQQAFDLITCVHGMHYVGDKLQALFKYAALLKPTGVMIVNLDTRDLFDRDGKSLARQLNRLLRGAGCAYDTRNKILRLPSTVTPFQFEYLGTDDSLGPNYTKQPTVGSFYSLS